MNESSKSHKATSERQARCLDRGWFLAEQSDWEAAAQAAKQVLADDSQSPEALHLLGYAMALSGEHDEALALYERSIALDDSFVEALLNAAELCNFPLLDFEKALQLCERALPLVENDEELTDALLLKFDALIGLEQTQEATELCKTLPKGPYANPEHELLIGRAFFELKDYVQAEAHLRDAEARDSTNADAPYYLGMILDEKGDARDATQAFLRSRVLDLNEEPAPWSLSPEQWQQVVGRAIASLSPHLRSALDPAEVYLAECPGVEVVAEGADPRAPVLVDVLDVSTPLLRAFLYKRNIERLAGSGERLESEIKASLERELAAAAFDEILAAPQQGHSLN